MLIVLRICGAVFFRWGCIATIVVGVSIAVGAQEPEAGASSSSPFRDRWEQAGMLNLASEIDPELGEWLYLHPVYRDAYAVGSEAGGNREEFREQNRARQRSQRGLDLAVYRPGLVLGLRASMRALNDYHYYGDGGPDGESDRWTGPGRPGETFAYFRWNPGESADPGAGDEAGRFHPGADRAALLVGSIEREEQLRRGLFVAGGRIFQRTESEGLLFAGEAPGGLLQWTGNGATALRLVLAGWKMEREVRAIGRPEGSPAAFYTGSIGLTGSSYSVSALYGFYRSPGRAAVPDLQLPGIPPTRVTVPTGQAALPDLDVHYYGLRFAKDFGQAAPFSLRGSFFYNRGREIAVDTAGTRIASSRREIGGALAFGEVVYHLGWEQSSPGCIASQPARVDCVRDLPVRRGPELALAGLYATRDRDDSDNELRGFGALRPLPGVMGGAASILLTGPAPGNERPPLRNYQPGEIFADSGVAAERLPDFDEARDNSDPARPVYDNQGLTMASLRFSAVPWRALTVDVFANYADFLTGDGFEGIAALRYPLSFVDVDLAVQASATAAWFRPSENEPDALTGELRKPATRFYARYMLGFVLAL